jgi:hypothetical protein
VSRIAAGTYARVSELPLEIDTYALDRLEASVTRGFTRVTTLVRLQGGGHEGVGEDVTWYTEAHDREQAAGARRALAGSWTLDSFSQALDIDETHKRWGYESAALDLALRQAETSLARLLEREPRPVTFVVSPGLGDPASVESIRRRLDRYPNLHFKLDPGVSWTDDLVRELAAAAPVEIVDFKAFYGADDAAPPDPALYRRVVDGFPAAWIEDPALVPATEDVLAPHRERITWDAPIQSIADVEALPFAPRTLNMKPSRFGYVRELLDFYDYCAEREIALYGGGMFELGAGRGQIQYLASLFHPDAPNDVAPAGYNDPDPPAGLADSPLAPPTDRPGFGAR